MVSIRGTLETFNLRELLQMLAFNQKVGTLRLETERGPRFIYVDRGRASLFVSDDIVSDSLVRLLTRGGVVDADRLRRAGDIARESGRYVGDVLVEMGVLTEEMSDGAFHAVVCERLFRAQLTAMHSFEFLDGQTAGPHGPDTPIEPYLPVEGLLLELTRRLDQWQQVEAIIPSTAEVFEGTGQSVDLSDKDEIDTEDVRLVVSCIDGYRSIEELSNASCVDLFQVGQVVAALFEVGAVRAVATTDLVARADQLNQADASERAIPLLRLALHRQDASADARLHLARALEQVGDAAGAAAELDAYAALNGDRDPAAVFDALKRSMRLRRGDLPTTARLCDYYLGNRGRLRAMKGEATDALRSLIHTASHRGTPLEAANRLAGFIERGDAPSEDLLVLADLYVAGGRPHEAAGALSQRAEDLMVGGRVAQARDLFRRALQCDPSLSGARRRLEGIDGERRRRSHRRRVNVTLALVVLVGAALAAAYAMRSNRVSRAFAKFRTAADKAVTDAESRASARVEAFQNFLTASASRVLQKEELDRESQALVADLNDIAKAPQSALAAYATEIERGASEGSATDAQRLILADLDRRARELDKLANQTVSGLRDSARDALKTAESENKLGRFRSAHAQLRTARNHGLMDPPTRERAMQLLTHVERYIQHADEAHAAIQEHIDRGDYAAAFQEGVGASRVLLDSDLSREIAFPVEVTSTPAGAHVWLGGTDTGKRTPCMLTYSVHSDDVTLALRLPGHRAESMPLPSYDDIAEDRLGDWRPTLRLTLTPGPQWVSPSKGKPDRDLWIDGELAVVLRGDGRTVQALSIEAGSPHEGSRAAAILDPMRLGGRLDIHEWRIRGQRTLSVMPHGSAEWTAHTLGRLEQRPVLSGEVVCLMDTIGTVYGYALEDGRELWRKTLNGRPTHAPVPAGGGFVVGTHNGNSFRVNAKTGAVQPLVPAVRGPAWALPLGHQVVVLGGGARGVRIVAADGTVTVRGTASPDLDAALHVAPGGVAWKQQGRVRWLSATDGTARWLHGLGRDVAFVGGDRSTVFAVSQSGVLRVLRPNEPGSAWACPLGRAPRAAPVASDHTIYVLVKGGVAAVQR